MRRLVVRHLHVHQSNLKRELLEWNTPGGGDPESRASRELAIRKPYSPPKRAFPLYKSAEAHTKLKKSIPRSLYVLAVCIVLAVALSWYVVGRMKARLNGENPEQASSQRSQQKIGQAGQGDSNAHPVKTTAQYIAELQPRIQGLAHTAPVYDSVTAPQDAPVPTGCLVNHKLKTCRCIDQQGNNYSTTDSMCRQIVDNGLFIAWRKKEQIQQSPQEPARSEKALPVASVGDSSVATKSVPVPFERQEPPPMVPQDSPWRFKSPKA